MRRTHANQSKTHPKAPFAPKTQDDRRHLPSGFSALQSSIGNQAVQHLLLSGVVQAKLAIDAPDSPMERQADRLADEALHSNPPSVVSSRINPHHEKSAANLESKQPDRSPARRSSSLPAQIPFIAGAIGSRGRPLDSSTRAFFEPRFGTDFSQVRIHTGFEAAASARAIDAKAYTLGHNIVFGEREFATHTNEGRRLLGHELVHTLQQAGAPAQPRLQRQHAPLAQLCDDLDADASRGVITDSEQAYLQILRQLCHAVDSGDKNAIKASTAILIVQKPSHLLPSLRDVDFSNKVISRTLLLGMDAEATALRKYFRKNEDNISRTKHGPDIYLWKELTEETIAKVRLTTPSEAETSLSFLLHTYKTILNEALSQDLPAIKAELDSKKSVYSPGNYQGSEPPDYNSLQTYFYSVLNLLPVLAIPIQESFQVLLDAGIADLEARKTPPVAFDKAKRILAEIKQNTEPDSQLREKFNKANLPTHLPVDITRSVFSKHGGKHLDYFKEGKEAEASSIKFSFYSDDQQPGSEKSLELWRIVAIREKQIGFLENLYGKKLDKSGNLTADSAENAAIIDKQGAPHLHSVDDWREFLRAKVKAQKSAGKSDAEALDSAMLLVKDYLSAFTIHSPFDLAEFGDNYLTRTFPKALTGQLIHDCGVYALRVAYMLSLVREDLHLRFRFIRLPLHLGLIITASEEAQLPTYLLHNDTIFKVTEDDMAYYQKFWQEHDDQGNAISTPKKFDEPRFIGSLAAGAFIPNVDEPFRLEDVPDLTGKDPKKARKIMWDFYHKKALPDVIAKDPSSGEDQLQLRYLSLLDRYKSFYNAFVLDFWNGNAPKAWENNSKLIAERLAAANRDPAKQPLYKEAIDAYVAILNGLMKPLNAELNEQNEEKKEIIKLLAEHPKLVANGATIARGLRIGIDYSWVGDMAKHIGEAQNMNNLADPRKLDLLTPPFVKPPALEPID